MTTRTTIVGGLAAVTLLGGLATAAAATTRHGDEDHHVTHAGTRLVALNKSGAHGAVRVKLHGHTATVSLRVSGVLAGAPHAMHIHAGGAGRCPTVRADANRDGIVSTTEGHRAYGHVVVSLTTKGDTSPNSALAIDRFPTAPYGEITYERRITVNSAVAHHIREGNAVVVVHGIDVNRNRRYDFGAGKSDLNRKLPLEATSPAACGPLSVQTKY